MAQISKLIPFILKWEGGYINDPADLGGATNKGVTLATYETYCYRKGFPMPTVERLKNIPEAHWNEIIKTMFWDKWSADEINSQSVANILVDWVWASGSYGIKLPQKILNVEIDGIAGPVTVQAVNSWDARKLFDAIKAERVAYIDRICKARPQNERFRKGWMNRLMDIKFEG